MSNAGQTCIGIERVYATERRLRRVRRRGHRAGAHAAPGSDDEASYGPMTMAVAGRHRAAAHRGRARRRRPRRCARTPTRACSTASFVAPTVLLDVPEDVGRRPRGDLRADADRSRKVRDAEEALERANATRYGLGGAVFAKSKARGLDLARRMRSGMTSVNSVLAFASVPGAALRRRRRQRLRPDPRRGRAQGVHPRQGDHPAAVRPAGDADAFSRRPAPPTRWRRSIGLIHGRHRS